MALLDMKVPNHYPGGVPRVPPLQHSLLVSINIHLLRLLLIPYISVTYGYSCPLNSFKGKLTTFINKVGYVSDRFFNSAFVAVTVFLETNTFSIEPKHLSSLFSISSLFGAEVQSVFLQVNGEFTIDHFLVYSQIISGLEITVRNRNDLQFLNHSTNYFPILKQLHVSVHPSISMALFKMLKVNSTVTSVNLRDNYIGDEGVRTLADALKVNTAVLRVNLWDNIVDVEGATALAEALKVNSTVTTVDLSSNCIGDEGARALAEALKVNSIVTNEGARALADSLKVNTTVTSVDLCNNVVGDEGARALAEALKVNSTVTSVDLHSNVIKDVGARSLADVLKVNTSLAYLNVSENSIANDGARALIEALKVTSSTIRINLSENSFDDECAQSLTALLNIGSRKF
ncbi:hypothetical protein GEMRC1_014039 [Eukaryota sp. GEM-RC1]